MAFVQNHLPLLPILCVTKAGEPVEVLVARDDDTALLTVVPRVAGEYDPTRKKARLVWG